MRRPNLFSLSLLLVSVAAAVLLSYLVQASDECGDEICLGLPETISGTVDQDGYFSGPIEIASRYSQNPAFNERQAKYSLDGGATWVDAANPETLAREHGYTLVGDNPISIAEVSTGGYIVVWAEPGANGSRISAQRYDENGDLVGEKIIVRDLNNPTSPTVAVTSNGSFTVAWVEQQEEFSAPFARSYNSNSIPLDQPWMVQKGITLLDLPYAINVERALSPIAITEDDMVKLVWVEMGTRLMLPTQHVSRVMAVILNPARQPERYWTVHAVEANDGFSSASPLISADPRYIAFVNMDGDLRLAGPGGEYLIRKAFALTKFHAVRLVALTQTKVAVAWVEQACPIICPRKVFGQIIDYIPEANTYLSGDLHEFPGETTVGILDGWKADAAATFLWSTKKSSSVFSVDDSGAWTTWKEVLSGEGVALEANMVDGGVVAATTTILAAFPKDKLIRTGSVDPKRNINVKLLLRECTTQPCKEWLSPVRNYFYADPQDGANGSISYPNGYRRDAAVSITIDMRCDTCVSLQLQERSAPLDGGVCGTYVAWENFGSGSSLNTAPVMDITDGRCYQYRATVKNRAGKTYTYTSTNTVKADRTEPTISVTGEELEWDLLTLALDIWDSASGIAKRVYTLNGGPETTFTGSSTSMAISDGQNRIGLAAEDAAANRAEYTHFVLADLTPPDIVIHSLEEGGTYGDDITLVYSLTQELQNLSITVDGIPRTDLVGLADGLHTLVIQGVDARGNVIKKTIHFTVDRSVFSLTLLSPQARLYQTKNLDIQYQASQAPARVWYTLNGGAQSEDLRLTDLADGVYNITVYAESPSGEVASRSVTFTVQDAIPALEVVAPVEGAVYTRNQLQLSFMTNGSVSYEVGTQSGTVRTGDTLTLPDGSHTLKLTATHPISGNVVTKAITFSVDTLEPQITLTSPASRLYVLDNIPVRYTPNKALSNIVMTLDGEEVSSLDALSPGNHTFAIKGEDTAGRTASRQVQFSVAKLDIVTPADGAEVVSDTNPPTLDFEYAAEGSFTSFNVAFDRGPRQLLSSSETTFSMAPGRHEVVLRGNVNEFVASKRSAFYLGVKNVTVSPGSIDYRYENCSASGCDVTVTLKVKNTGDYAIGEPFQVRFDHVSPNGYESQTEFVPGVGLGETAEVVLQPVRAAIGDTFAVTLDPYSQMSGEWREDNRYQLQFVTGQISGVALTLPASNAYLEGVSVLNELTVKTAGPVESVEIRANGWAFVDNTRENGFHLTADIGLLTTVANCYQIAALSADGVALDSRHQCFSIKSLSLPEVTPFRFPWEKFHAGTRYVIQSEIEARDFEVERIKAQYAALAEPASLFPMIRPRTRGEIIYKLMADPGLIEGRPYMQEVELGRVGNVQLSNGHGIFVSTFSPRDGSCGMDGGLAIHSEGMSVKFDELIAQYAAEELAELNRAERGYLEDRPEVVRNNAFVEFPLFSLGWVNAKVPNDFVQFEASGGLRGGFVGEPICVTDERNGELEVVMQGRMVSVLRGRLHLATREVSASASVLHGGVASLTTVDLFRVDATVYPLDIRVPLKYEMEVGMSLVGGRFYVGPGRSSFTTSTAFNGRVVGATFTPFMWKVARDKSILGGSVDLRAELQLDGSAKADTIFGSDGADSDPYLGLTDSQYRDQFKEEYSYSYLYRDIDVILEEKICIWGWCKKASMPLDAVLWILGNYIASPVTEVTGKDYDRSSVAQRYEELLPFDYSAIADLGALGLLMTALTGNSEGSGEYAACGLAQTFIAKEMRNPPLYVSGANGCALVANPDFESYTTIPYYSDSACRTEVPFKPTSFLSYCRNNLLDVSKIYVGNASMWDGDGDARYASLGKNSRWTLAHGASLDVLVVPPKRIGNGAVGDSWNRRPFVKQVEYRTVDDCHLEMRVFKRDINASNLKPLLLLHGGAWKWRGLGTIGAEALVSHFTEQGYVVFEPFYRLMSDGRGDSDGPSECQLPAGGTGAQVPGELIVQDIEYALDWVKTHGLTLGAASGAVTAVGQSAGAHLAAWLGAHHSSDIDQLLLFYPPTDFPYFVEQRNEGKYANSYFDEAEDLVSTFLGGVDIGTLNATNLTPFMKRNGFPDIIGAGMDFPPTFLIHGNKDTTVPAEMSTRMCDALAGTPYADVSAYDLDTLTECGESRGRRNKTAIISSAPHMLDLCVMLDSSVLAFGNSARGMLDAESEAMLDRGGYCLAPYSLPSIAEGISWLQ